MAISQYTGESYPGTVVSSDVRYGETFLNLEYLDKAAPGEIMKDPMTGELYLRRSIDGKVVSFVQRTVSVFDFLSEFNLQLQSAEGFRYPEHSGGYLLGVKYDVNTMVTHHRGELFDIYNGNLVFPRDIDANYNFVFNISTETNGIYIKAIMRDGDRIGVGWLTGKFSEHETVSFASVSRKFKDWLVMNLNYKDGYLYDTWKEMRDWVSSNAMIDLTITTTGTRSTGAVITNTVDITRPIRLNEQTYVLFPDSYKENMQGITSVQVEVKKIYFPKIQYEYDMCKTSQSSTGLSNPFATLIEADLRACLKSVDMYYFISAPSELPLTDNRIIHQCVGYDFFTKAIDNILTASGTRSVQSQPLRPKSWGVDSIWAEEIRHIIPGGESVPSGSSGTFDQLEDELYGPELNPVEVEFTQYDVNKEDIYIKEV